MLPAHPQLREIRGWGLKMIWDLLEGAVALYVGFLLAEFWATRRRDRELAPDPFDAYLRDVQHTCGDRCLPDHDSHWIAERKAWVRR